MNQQDLFRERRLAQLAVDEAVLAKRPPAELAALKAKRDQLWSREAADLAKDKPNEQSSHDRR